MAWNRIGLRMRRWIAILLLGLLIVSLSLYSVLHHPWIGVKTCLKDPEACDGILVTHFNEPRIGPITPEGFLLIQRQTPSIQVTGHFDNLKEGEYVDMQAIFHKNGTLEAVAFQVARNRREKIWVSIIPVLVVGILLARTFRFNPQNLQVEARRHA